MESFQSNALTAAKDVQKSRVFFTSGLKHYIMYAFITYCSNIVAVIGVLIVFLNLVTRASGTIHMSTRIR